MNWVGWWVVRWHPNLFSKLWVLFEILLHVLAIFASFLGGRDAIALHRNRKLPRLEVGTHSQWGKPCALHLTTGLLDHSLGSIRDLSHFKRQRYWILLERIPFLAAVDKTIKEFHPPLLLLTTKQTTVFKRLHGNCLGGIKASPLDPHKNLVKVDYFEWF
jgi:hypothetical protein